MSDSRVWSWVPVEACPPLELGLYLVLIDNNRMRVVKWAPGWLTHTRPSHVYCCRGVPVVVEEPNR